MAPSRNALLPFRPRFIPNVSPQSSQRAQRQTRRGPSASGSRYDVSRRRYGHRLLIPEIPTGSLCGLGVLCGSTASFGFIGKSRDACLCIASCGSDTKRLWPTPVKPTPSFLFGPRLDAFGSCGYSRNGGSLKIHRADLPRRAGRLGPGGYGAFRSSFFLPTLRSAGIPGVVQAAPFGNELVY